MKTLILILLAFTVYGQQKGKLTIDFTYDDFQELQTTLQYCKTQFEIAHFDAQLHLELMNQDGVFYESFNYDGIHTQSFEDITKEARIKTDQQLKEDIDKLTSAEELRLVTSKERLFRQAMNWYLEDWGKYEAETNDIVQKHVAKLIDKYLRKKQKMEVY